MGDFINIDDSRYPISLRTLKTLPKKLFYRGEWHEEIFNYCVAFVGTRSCSPYGERVVRKLISELSQKITIVSGFMTGIDMVSHKSAVEFGLKTIAVLPCGISADFPAGGRSLYNSIVSAGGLILSEYSGDTPPRKWTFLERNRLVAGLSKVVVVIEAGLKSGSLHTAGLAQEYGRILYAVPGSILSSLSKGTHQLISNGGKLLDTGADINKELDLEQTLYSEKEDTDVDDSSARVVLESIRSAELTFEEILLVTGLDNNTLNNTIVQLSLGGKILERFGKYYAC